VSALLAYLAASLVGMWGVAHALPTRQVVRSFGAISADNRLVMTQEWIVEALAMWFTAAVLILVTALGASSDLAHWVYRLTAVMLAMVAAWTAATGARTPVVWFKICVGLLTSTSVLLILASLI
jgi:hypothetical protein